MRNDCVTLVLVSGHHIDCWAGTTSELDRKFLSEAKEQGHEPNLKRLGRLSAVLCCALVLQAGTVATYGTIEASNQASDLGSLDLQRQSQPNLSIGTIVFSPNGTLVGSDGTSLFTVNIQTGAQTLVGFLGLPTNSVALNIRFDAGGNLYQL